MNGADNIKNKEIKDNSVRQNETQRSETWEGLDKIKHELTVAIESLSPLPSTQTYSSESVYEYRTDYEKKFSGANNTFTKKEQDPSLKDVSCMADFDEKSSSTVSKLATNRSLQVNLRKQPRRVTSYQLTAEQKRLGRIERLLSLFRLYPKSQNFADLYKVSFPDDREASRLPRRLVFNLIEGIPKPPTSTTATNTNVHTNRCKYIHPDKYMKNYQNEKFNRSRQIDSNNNDNVHLNNNKQNVKSHNANGQSRVDFYYFDHGNARYFNTTDVAPVAYTDIIAEKTEAFTTKFWAEIFNSVHVLVSFVTSFVLQLFKFLLYSILRPLTVGLVQLSSDYFFKPFLTTLFNAVIQPILIFVYNIATSIRDLCEPIAEGIGYFFREIAVIFQAIRLFVYNKVTYNNSCEECSRNYENSREYDEKAEC